jgi:L-ascorbate metabolism protein UlaG (beta-lactamase superfamily)
MAADGPPASRVRSVVYAVEHPRLTLTIAPRLEARELMDPAEALEALALLGARQLVPIHYETFINSDDAPGQCGQRLRAAMRRRAIGAERVHILSIGEQRVLIARPWFKGFRARAQRRRRVSVRIVAIGSQR